MNFILRHRCNYLVLRCADERVDIKRNYSCSSYKMTGKLARKLFRFVKFDEMEKSNKQKLNKNFYGKQQRFITQGS